MPTPNQFGSGNDADKLTPATLGSAKTLMAYWATDTQKIYIENSDRTGWIEVTTVGSSSAFTDEKAQDASAAMLVAGTGITLNYDDSANHLTINSTTSTYTDEMAQDAIAALLVPGPGINTLYDDSSNQLTITSLITQYTDEMAQDATASLLVAGSGITLSYDDTANQLTINSTSSGISQYTDEMAQDATAAMITAGSGITVSYDDPNNTLTISSSVTQYTDEMAQDATASLLVAGTGITLNYDDAANHLTVASTVVAPTIDTDGTLSANNDLVVPSQKAVKTYVDNTAVGLLDYKGAIDCSANPNYPSALKGDAYVVSIAGKIGGTSGLTVETGDFIFAKADNAGGDQATVGSSWDVLQYNLSNVVISTNNLSDLTNIPQARRNLGLEPAPTAVSGTSYTLALADDGQYLRTSNSSATTITIPLNSAVAFSIGTVVTIEQGGSGLVTIAATSGVTLNSRSGTVNSAGQWAVLQLKKVATDTWTLIGDVA